MIAEARALPGRSNLYAGRTLSPTQQFAVLSLIVLLVLGGGLAWYLSAEIERQMVMAVADVTGRGVMEMIRVQLSAGDLQTPMTGARYQIFDAFLRRHILRERIARVKVWNKAGVIIYADDPALVGQVFPVEDELRAVYTRGEVVAELASLHKAEHVAERGLGPLLEIYVPLIPRDSEEVLGAYEVYIRYDPIAASVRRAQITMWGSVTVAVAGLWGGLFWVFARASRAIARQRHLAITDPLTGLYNRRYLLEQLACEHERGRRYGTPFALILLDLDCFKNYNDAHGHPAGDAALCELATRLRTCVRHLDAVARYGGEEFAILLPATDLSGAVSTAERIRKCVAAHPFARGPITVSLGVACSDDHLASDMITAADLALYRAKHEGRNRVCVAGEE